MRRWIIWITILLILAAGGFCIYWFLFRDTSQGGDLTNKETLFAVQSVLKDQNVDLETIVKDHQEVSFTSSHDENKSVEADGEILPVTSKFAGITTETLKKTTLDKDEFDEFYKKPLIFAYSALYSNVFENKYFKQNVWYYQTFSSGEGENKVEKTYKIKISTKDNNLIYILLYDESNLTFNEMTITFNFKNETNVYSIENKITIVNKNGIISGENITDNYTYKYAYFNRNASRILNYDSLSFSSDDRIKNIQKFYDFYDLEITSSYFVKDDKQYTISSPKFIENWDEKQLEIEKYVVEDLDVNFKEQNKCLNANIGSTTNLEYAGEYFK